MSKIEWTEQTWNPFVGCTKISPGCKNCYAEKRAYRLKRIGQLKYEHVINNEKKWTNKISLPTDKLLRQPERRMKPTMYFVCSMGDIFHEVIHLGISQIRAFEVMASCPQHTFQILTKRPKHMKSFFSKHPRLLTPNLWLGVTVEKAEYLWRVQTLLSIPAKTHFVSIEPMLSRIELQEHSRYLWDNDGKCLNWVIAGCESGKNRRPSQIGWFRHLRDQCVDAAVPFFLKQMDVGGKLVKMPPLDGRVWDQRPEINNG
jgi:protein gp37